MSLSPCRPTSTFAVSVDTMLFILTNRCPASLPSFCKFDASSLPNRLRGLCFPLPSHLPPKLQSCHSAKTCLECTRCCPTQQRSHMLDNRTKMDKLYHGKQNVPEEEQAPASLHSPVRNTLQLQLRTGTWPVCMHLCLSPRKTQSAIEAVT